MAYTSLNQHMHTDFSGAVSNRGVAAIWFCIAWLMVAAPEHATFVNVTDELLACYGSNRRTDSAKSANRCCFITVEQDVL